MLHFNGGHMIIPREMKSELLRLSHMYPVLSVTGPRQSGKTTLARETFPDYAYVSLEDPDMLSAFEDDPRTFLRAYGSNVIFDEAQRAPELFQYLQQVVDASNQTGRFVLTGSQNFLLMDAINQSLAGSRSRSSMTPGWDPVAQRTGSSLVGTHGCIRPRFRQRRSSPTMSRPMLSVTSAGSLVFARCGSSRRFCSFAPCALGSS